MNSACAAAVLFGLLCQLLLHVSLCDLPSHATIRDVKGTWRFSLTKPSDRLDSCGGLVPNSNVQNLKLDPGAVLSARGGEDKSYTFDLSDDAVVASDYPQVASLLPGHRSGWEVLPIYTAESPGTPAGYWTMTFDEGYELIMKRRGGEVMTLSVVLKYEREDSENCRSAPPHDGDNENSDGSTGCYKTSPDKSLYVWGMIRSPQHTYSHFCGSGEKLGVSLSQGDAAQAQYVRTDQQRRDHGIPFAKVVYMPVADSGDEGVSFAQVTSSSSLHTGLYACPVIRSPASPSLPKNFSWGDPFAIEGYTEQPDQTIINQGGCGSCFAIASSYVMQERAKILLKAVLGENFDASKYFADEDRLSPRALVSCSWLSQGCDGGLPYNLGRFAAVAGAVTDGCMPYHSDDEKQCALSDVLGAAPSTPFPEVRNRRISSTAILSPTFLGREKDHESFVSPDRAATCEKRTFASSYGYVGGCYECTSQERMMEELYHRGPLIVAVDAPSSMFGYRPEHGVFTDSPRSHHKICADPEKNLNGWEFTTHALTLVGWGENETQGPYWILRNSWGPHWGKDGYLMLRRGENTGGIEAQSVYIDPDPYRGYLKEILEKHGASPDKVAAFMRKGANDGA